MGFAPIKQIWGSGHRGGIVVSGGGEGLGVLIVDTYNVLGVTGVLPPDLAGLDAGGLAALVGRSRWRRGGCVLVCDGTGGGVQRGGGYEDHAGVRVVYAGPGRDADGHIRRLVLESSAPRRLTVVSSDRAVQRSARVRRCRVVDSPTFLRGLVRDVGGADTKVVRRPQGVKGRDQTLAWMAELGVDVDPWASIPAAEAVKAERKKDSAKDLAEAAGSAGSERKPRGETPAVEPVGEDGVAGGVSGESLADDPVIRAALEEWRDRLSVDDLDMSRWLDGPGS